MTKGSLKLRLAAIVRTGSKQQNKAPKRIIFPICGSTGNRAKCTPSGVSSSCLSKAFCHKKKKTTQSHNCSVEDAANCSMVRHESDRANYKQKHSTDTRKEQPSLTVFQVVYWAQCLSGLKYED